MVQAKLGSVQRSVNPTQKHVGFASHSVKADIQEIKQLQLTVAATAANSAAAAAAITATTVNYINSE